MKPTILLIDADSLIFSSCFAEKDSPDKFETNIDEAEHKFSEKLMRIETDIEEKYGDYFDVCYRVLFFEGRGNFRKFLNKDYKANRKDVERPPLIEPLKDIVQNKEHWKNLYSTFISYNVETDDSIAATYKKWWGNGYDLIICSSDKDFKTLPCVIYDYYYTRCEINVITDEMANYNFYTQMLVGDAADNVKGVKGIGAKGAEKILKDCNSKFSMQKAVFKEYLKKHKTKAREEYIKNYVMLKLNTEGLMTPDIEELTF